MACVLWIWGQELSGAWATSPLLFYNVVFEEFAHKEGIAVALVMKPDVLLMDEPTLALASIASSILRNYCSNFRKK